MKEIIEKIKALPKGERLHINTNWPLVLITDDLHSLVEHIEKLEAMLAEVEAEAWLIGRAEYIQLQGDVLVEIKDGEGVIVIKNPDSEDDRETIGCFDTVAEAVTALKESQP